MFANFVIFSVFWAKSSKYGPINVKFGTTEGTFGCAKFCDDPSNNSDLWNEKSQNCYPSKFTGDTGSAASNDSNNHTACEKQQYKREKTKRLRQWLFPVD